MFRSKYALAAVGSATWALVSPKLRTRTTCESEERSDVKKEKEKDRYENEILAVYLTEESVQQVNKFLAKRGITDREARLVCFRSANVRPDYTYIYSSLYGSKAAFRLKGLITIKDNKGGVEHLIGTGRLCNMVGEIKEEDFVVSIPMMKKGVSESESGSGSGSGSEEGDIVNKAALSAKNFNLLLDIPTRLDATTDKEGKKLTSYGQWKGSLPVGRVLERNYWRLNNVSYWALPPKLQFVVDGTVCSSAYWDGTQGGCNYDKDEDYDGQSGEKKSSISSSRGEGEGEGKIEKKVSNIKQSESESASESDEEEEEDEEGECPVCAYMKAGPCKESYLNWTAKVDQIKPEENGKPSTEIDDKQLKMVLDSATDMLRCMVKYEYYDMMTANTDMAALQSIPQKKKETEAGGATVGTSPKA